MENIVNLQTIVHILTQILIAIVVLIGSLGTVSGLLSVACKLFGWQRGTDFFAALTVDLKKAQAAVQKFEEQQNPAGSPSPSQSPKYEIRQNFGPGFGNGDPPKAS